MAIIKHMIAERVISGFKGTLDFYYYMGVACVRKWPKKPSQVRTPAVRAWWAPFTYASREWANLSAEVQRTYEELATGSGLRGFDMFMRAYMTGLFRNPIP